MKTLEFVKPVRPSDLNCKIQQHEWHRSVEQWYAQMYPLADTKQRVVVEKATNDCWDLYMVGPYSYEDSTGEALDEKHDGHLFVLRKDDHEIAIIGGGKILHFVNMGDDFNNGK